MKEKSMIIGTLLTMLIPGLGHLYINKYLEGSLLIASVVVINVLDKFFGYANLLMIIVYLYAFYSLYNGTKARNKTIREEVL